MSRKLTRDEKRFVQGKNYVHPLNVYRTIAVMIVFLLHTFLFSSQLGFSYSVKTWFLKTPAWAGVWLFFLLSGYLIGKGFISGRYKEGGKYTVKSILRFYMKRLIKVGVPTWTFCFLSVLLLSNGFFIENKMVIFKILTFRYYNNPSSTIIGATWYISSLMSLYLCAPFIALLLEWFVGKLKNWKGKLTIVYLLFVVIAIFGLMLRIHLYKKGVDWSSRVYVPFYCNLDIYICGMLINFFDKDRISTMVRKFLGVGSFLLLVAVVIVNARIYYLSDINASCLFFYQYIFPTVYILTGGLFLFIWGDYKEKQCKLNLESIIRNPLRLIDGFAEISFEFYLVHSMVLGCTYNIWVGTSPFRAHLLLLITAFGISAILSLLMHNAFRTVEG